MKFIEWKLLLSLFLLLLLGLIFVFSALPETVRVERFLHFLTVTGLGLVLAFLIAILNYQVWEEYSKLIYFLAVLLLASLPFLGSGEPARRWIEFGKFSFQPAELAKLGLIILLAKILSPINIDKNRFLLLVKCLFIGGIPIALVLIQPDLGTSTLLFLLILGMLYIAGIRKTYIFSIITITIEAMAVIMGFTWLSWLAGQEMISAWGSFLINCLTRMPHLLIPFLIIFLFSWLGWWLLRKFQIRLKLSSLFILTGVLWLGILAGFAGMKILKEYQRERLIAFLAPGVDPRGSGYQVIQSRITVGSGRLAGKGLMKGTQAQLGFLPTRHTDFVFAVICEEQGWFGASFCLVVLAALFYRIFKVSLVAKDEFGRLLSAGIGIWLLAQSLLNIGMVLGFLPVVGIPLPFLSYGGSAQVINLIALGIVHSIYSRRYMY